VRDIDNPHEFHLDLTATLGLGLGFNRQLTRARKYSV
jgi:hypothetical protein